MTINPDALRAALKRLDYPQMEGAFKSALEAYNAALPLAAAAAEPVAWRYWQPGWNAKEGYWVLMSKEEGVHALATGYDREKISPLYTHPAPPSTDALTWRDMLPAGHVILEQAEMQDGRVSQTVRADDGEEYQRIVHADEAFPEEGSPPSTDAAREAVMAEPTAWRDVIAERQRQVSAEGWTAEHDDDKEQRGELAIAAACYAAPQAVYWGPTFSRALLEWPWRIEWWKPSDGKRGRPLDRRRDLVKAGALILAEIERLDRDVIRARPAP